MTFTELYNECLWRVNEVADEVEKYDNCDDPSRLIHQRAYGMAVETYFANAFEIVDALRGDGNLFDAAEHAAGEELYGLQSNFSDWVYAVAYWGVIKIMYEQAERRGLDLT